MNNLIALLSDSHFGARGDCQKFAAYFNRFYKEQFFPFLFESGIDEVVHLGDILDRRKFVNYLTAYQIRDNLFAQCNRSDVDLRVIIGNHDTFYKHTNAVNCMDVLAREFDEYICWHTQPSEAFIGGKKVLLVPWINRENEKRTFEMIEATDAEYCFGHLELEGFGMYKGVENHDGIDPGIFKKFKRVLSGHFHHRSTKGNVSYLGPPYEITWSDYNDPRGFHVLDMDSGDLVFIENPLKMFKKFKYDDSKIKSLDEIKALDFSGLKDKQVKLIVMERTNPLWFDVLVQRIEEVGVGDLQVVDDHKYLDLVVDSDILVNEKSDTLSIFNSYVGNLENISDQGRVSRVINEIYAEAINR